MSLSSRELYDFDNFRLDVGERLLLRNGERVQLPEKAFEILCVLIRQRGHLVSKDHLLSEVWPETVVEENNLDKNVSLLRRVLHDQNGKQKLIETVRGRGYRFVADAREIASDSDSLDVDRRSSSSSTFKNLNTGSPRRPASLRSGTVVALADWRHESQIAHEAGASADPQNIVQTPNVTSRRTWLAGLLIAGCIGVGLLGLYSWRAIKTDAPINSVAVLPFVNVGADAELEYLADGLSESLIDRLSELPQLKVIARSSSFKYRDENADLQDLAHKLDVRAIVTGRVARRGDELTIRIELIDARDNKQLWGEQFNRKAGDALTVQADIARIVSGKMRLKLSGEQERQLVKRGTENPQAFDLLLKGDFSNKKSATRIKALEYYDQAIALDSTYALAYAKLAGTYQNLAGSSELDPKDVLPKVLAAAQRAIELDENLAEAHHVLAELARDRWDWTTAESEYKLALELEPNLVSAHRRYSNFLSDMGRHEQAISEAERVKELDPQQLSSHAGVAFALLVARRFDESIIEIKKTLELDQIYGLYALLGHAYAGKGLYGEAVTAYKKAIGLGSKETYHLICLGAAYARAGERDEARAILKQLETSEVYVSPGELSILYAALGEREKAFETLEKAYAAHDLQLQHLSADPGFDPLREDPRFQDLLRRVGLPE